MDNPQVLIVDDDDSMSQLIADVLARRSLDPLWTTSPSEALEILKQNDIDVVITDLKMENFSGLDLCERVVNTRPDVPVVVITAFGSLESAVGAMRSGAYDYLTKPFDMEELLLTVRRAVQHRTLQNEVKRLRELVEHNNPIDDIIGESMPMQRVFELIRRVADTDVTVLLTGESGTGKELVARALHNHSRRNNGPFVAFNCAALPPSLIESELFGHAKGAFTGAASTHIGLLQQANHGTLFLDEIGEMPLEMQAKLLRTLQEKKVRPVGGDQETPFDARVIAASNHDLEEAVERRRFREDLFYRINVVSIDLPPLRARGSDILLLAQHFIEKAANRTGKDVHGLTGAAAKKMLAYDWPGNVRELQNSMERAVALTAGDEITVDDLPERVRRHASSSITVSTDDPATLLPMAEVEQQYIQSVLKTVGGNKTAAARILGVDRRTLYRKLERFSSGTEGR